MLGAKQGSVKNLFLHITALQQYTIITLRFRLCSFGLARILL